MIVGGYTLDLYCRNHPTSGGSLHTSWGEEGVAQFTGRSVSGCRGLARRAGWRFVAGDVLCPACVRASARPKVAAAC